MSRYQKGFMHTYNIETLTRAFYVALAVFLLNACGQPPQQQPLVQPVRAMQVANIGHAMSRTFPGRAKATQELDIAFEVAGKLVQRPVDIGTEVKAGQLLAILDPRDFENKLASAKAERKRAQAHLSRIRVAVKSGAVSQQDLTDAQARFEAAEANVNIRAKALEDSVLHAPFDGNVAMTFVENFQNVQAKQPVMRLLDHSRIEMVINIPESMISYAPLVDYLYVVFDPFPGHEIRATIKEIGTEASQTTRTFPVTLIMDPPDDIKILPGMAGRTTRAEGELPQEYKRNAIHVPVSAVFSTEENNKSFVWIIDDESQTVTRREVSVGVLADVGMRITAGLQTGEWVATAGVNYLTEGQQVRILEN